MAFFEELLTPIYSTVWGRWASLVVLFSLSILVVITLVRMPMTWREDFVLAHEQKKSIPTNAISTNQSSDLSSQIPNWHLFGTAAKADAFLPITSLQLRLIGVIHDSGEQLSRVMISEAGQPGKVYKVGDQFSGVKVNAIAPDGVILENGGQLEKLPLQRQELEFRGRPKK